MKFTRKRGIALALGVVAGFVIWWAGISAPKKEIIIKKALDEDISTGGIRPSYSLYYKWDRKVQTHPWWMIVKTSKTEGEWKVIQLKDVRTLNNPEEILKYAVRFDSKWVEGYRFSAQPSRYQMLLLLLAAQPLFSEEKEAFYQVLNEIGKNEK